MLRNAFSFILGAHFLIFSKQLWLYFVICSVALNTGKLKLLLIKLKITIRRYPPQIISLWKRGGKTTVIWERPGFKFINSIWRPFSTLRRCEAIVGSFCGLRKGDPLWQHKPKKGTLRKQLTVNSLPNNLFKTSFFYLHLIDQLIYWLKHFDSRNTYLWHPWQLLRVTGYTENPELHLKGLELK